MTNPNNNQNAYKQALEINRELKRENDKIKAVLVFTIQSLDEEFSKDRKSVV